MPRRKTPPPDAYFERELPAPEPDPEHDGRLESLEDGLDALASLEDPDADPLPRFGGAVDSPGGVESQEDKDTLEADEAESLETLDDAEEAGEEEELEEEPDPEPDPGDQIPLKPPPPVKTARRHQPPVTRHLPPSKVYHYQEERKTWAAKPARFFDYWKKLEELPWAKDRLLCYVYRTYPVLKDGCRQTAKVPEHFPMEDLIRLFGAGDYHLKLVDAGMGYKNLAICTVKNVGERNWNEHTPVLDPDAVELDDPLNRPYLSWARSRGIAFPGDALWEANRRAKREQEAGVAEAQIVNRAWDWMERQAGEAGKKQGRDDVPTDALSKSIELISKAGDVQAKILEKGIDRVMEMQKQNRTSENPTSGLKETVELVKMLLPQPGGQQGGVSDIQRIVDMILNMESKHADKLFQIQTQMREAQDKEIVHLKEQMTRLIERAHSPTAPAGAAATVERPRNLREQLLELKESKDLIRGALGLDSDEKSGGDWTEHLPLIVQAGSVLVGSVASIVHNLAVLRGNGGQPTAPPPIGAALSPEQNEALGAMGRGAPGQAQPQPRPQPAPAPAQENAMTRAHAFFGMITTPLLRSFNAGESGADFAARLVELTDSGFFGPESQGAQVYDQILEMGQPLINSLLKTFPPIWSVVGQTPAKWERFITDFFRAREIWAAEEAEDGAHAPKPAPVTVPKPPSQGN